MKKKFIVLLKPDRHDINLLANHSIEIFVIAVNNKPLRNN